MAAEFIYPARGNFSAENNDKMINVFDTLYVQYRSTWPSLNLTLFCLEGTTSANWYYLNVQSNPILASGTFKFGTIQSYNFNINQYPTMCKFKLTKYQDNDNGLNGEDFWITSNAASATIFQPASSASSSGGTTQSAKSTGPASVLASPSSSPTTTTTQTSSSAHSGLSTGAKAGVGIGVTVAVLSVLALIFLLIWRRRRKGQSIKRNNTYEKAELPSDDTTNNLQPYKHKVDSMEGAAPVELEAHHKPPVQHELPA
jgi:hypothetical protein